MSSPQIVYTTVTSLVAVVIALICLGVWRNRQQARLLNIMANARHRSDMERSLIEASVFRSTRFEQPAPSVSADSAGPQDGHGASCPAVVSLNAGDAAPLTIASTVPWHAGAPSASSGSHRTGTTPSLVSSDDFDVSSRGAEGQVAGAVNTFEPQFGPGLPVAANNATGTGEALRSLEQMLRDSRRQRFEDPAAVARLAVRHSKRMWKKVRLLILGLRAPESALNFLNMDVFRRIIWHVARSELPLVAVDSPAAPWARLVRGVSSTGASRSDHP